jgi:penicillin-binding protein 1C
LIVKTTLSREAQEAAEEAVQRNKKNMNDYGANNASMVYIDSLNGDVLAYVGSMDYFNEDIDGKVDMVRALRQP